MTKYTRQTGKQKTTQALLNKWKIQQEALREAISDLRNSKSRNRQRLKKAQDHLKRTTREPGRSQARENLKQVKRRCNLRVQIFGKKYVNEVKRSVELEKRVKRFQKQGRINHII